MFKVKETLPLLAVFAIAFAFWVIYYPAFMNGDSLVQYSEALSGVYDDWHPPLMAITLHYLLRLGVGVGTITLLQTMAGCMGVYLLSREILIKYNTSEKIFQYFPLILLLFLISPLSPLSFHLMAFIKDTWIAIGFIWIAFLALQMIRIKKEKPGRYKLLYFFLFCFMNEVILTRHNAIILIPVFFLILYFLSEGTEPSNKFKLKNTMSGVYLILVYVIVLVQINSAFKVTQTHPENQVFATESLGVLVNDSGKKKDLPYMASHLTPIYRKAYIPGNVAPIMWWGPIKAVDPTFDRNNKEFLQQYYDLLKHDPLSVLRVKWDGFIMMLKPSSNDSWFHEQLDVNQYGLVQNERFKDIRTSMINTLNSIYKNKIIQYCFGEPAIWIVINGIVFLMLFIRKRKGNAILISILLLPAGYYCSYLLASTGPDFRFMYPATVLMQVIVFSLAFVIIWKKFGKHQV
ncbi:MAG TPA: hypothetical protein VN922_19145 [Bacteroidia bacterium]|nr:hypothetical protein [Bacteroidia bacterium]